MIESQADCLEAWGSRFFCVYTMWKGRKAARNSWICKKIIILKTTADADLLLTRLKENKPVESRAYATSIERVTHAWIKRFGEDILNRNVFARTGGIYMTEFNKNNSEGPSKPGKSESDRAKSPVDPRSPGFDKKLDGPVRPSE